MSAQREEFVTQEEFDNMLKMGIINEDGTLHRDGQEIIFGPKLTVQDIRYVVSQESQP